MGYTGNTGGDPEQVGTDSVTPEPLLADPEPADDPTETFAAITDTVAAEPPAPETLTAEPPAPESLTPEPEPLEPEPASAEPETAVAEPPATADPATAAPEPTATGAGDEQADMATAQQSPLEALYAAYYRPLVRLAALLTTDLLAAEDIAADSLAALLSAAPDRDRSRATDRLQFRLRRHVIMRAREITSMPAGVEGTLADSAASRWQDSEVVRVLGTLPAGQREAVVLRHYLGLGDREVAALMGESQRAVRRTLTAASDPGIWASVAGPA
jgi:DNA-directed RNA polymerase specialized sigma24 family protein